MVLIEEAEKSFKGLIQVKGAHTGIQTSLNDAVKWLENSQNDLKTKLSAITTMVNETNATSG